MSELWGAQNYFFIIVATLSFWVTMFNIRYFKSLGRSQRQPTGLKHQPRVSILIPARNEADNIRHCLSSLVVQDYEFFEIIVLDDHSTDDTESAVMEFANADSRVHLLRGVDLPDGWIGKNWACHQLSQGRESEYLLFIDADTVLSPRAVSHAVLESQNSSTDLLTVIPKRIATCMAERLMFPFIDWMSYCWMPMRTAHASKNPHLSATFGQFIFFRRIAYEFMGGHKAISDNPLDDFELGRLAKKVGLKWKLLKGTNQVRVLAYQGNRAAFRAISRSIFPVFYYRTSVFAALSAVVLGLGLLPPVTVVVGVITYPQAGSSLLIASASTGMVATTWIISYRTFQHKGVLALLFPISLVLMMMVALHSMASYSRGATDWKGRKLSKKKIRL